MKYFVIFSLVFNICFSYENNPSQAGLINKNFIEDYMTFEAPWKESHGASKKYLGAGLLYYTLIYMSKAKFCVCLGSGGGFVPRLMRQAQRDLDLQDSKTILVDGNIGGWGRPQWLESNSFFKTNFSDIEIILDLTANVAKKHKEWKIDYLHIDADHSFEGALADFNNFYPLMNKPGIISFHDTNGALPCSKVIQVLKNKGFEVVNFKQFGAGVAIIHIN